MEVKNLIKYGIIEHYIHILKLVLVALVLSSIPHPVTSISLRTIFNPFTGKFQYLQTANFSGENIIADNYFYSNGTELSCTSLTINNSYITNVTINNSYITNVTINNSVSCIPGGNDSQVQFNDNNNFNGSNNFLYNKSSKKLYLNTTSSFYYYVDDTFPVGDGYTIHYTNDAGSGCFSQNDFINNEIPFFVQIYSYNITPYGIVYSSNPIVLEILPDIHISDCWYFDLNWTSENVFGYFVIGNYDSEPFIRDGVLNLSTNSVTIRYDTIWNDYSIFSGNPSPYVVNLNSVGFEVDGSINVSNSVYAGNIHTSSPSYFGQKIIVNNTQTYSGLSVVGYVDENDFTKRVAIGPGSSNTPRIAICDGSVCGQQDIFSNRYRWFIGGSEIFAIQTVSPFGMYIYNEIDKYKGQTTSGVGVPYIVNRTEFINRSLGISNTNLFQTSSVGEYRISYYFYTMIKNETNNCNLTLNFGWNDGVDKRNLSVGRISLSNTTQGSNYVYGSIPYVRVGSGSISYNVTNDTVIFPASYSLIITTERLN